MRTYVIWNGVADRLIGWVTGHSTYGLEIEVERLDGTRVEVEEGRLTVATASQVDQAIAAGGCTIPLA